MSHHQPRADRSDSQQRRGARLGGGSAHQRTSAGKGSGGGGQGLSAISASLPSPAVQPAPVSSTKKLGGVNGQPRGHTPISFDVSESQCAQQSTPSQQHASPVGHVQPGIKSSNGILPRSSKPGTPSSSSVSTEAAPMCPKPDTSWNTLVHPQLSFQFGSIGASIGPGPGPYLQIPARTSSAPPNLDEQKQELLRFEATSAQPARVPIPSGGGQVPRSQVPQSGGQQPHQLSFRPQPSYHQQGQQHTIPLHVTQPGSHLQASSVVNTQGQLQMQPRVIPSQPQQHTMLHMPYQHTLQPQMQHNGMQIMKYPSSMAGPALMAPTLASPPGSMQTTHISQLSHQLPGGLGSGISGQPYGVAPVSSSVIPPRTSVPVKITHPDTHEELKFDFKSTKRDNSYDGGMPVTTAIPPSSMAGNGRLQAKTPLGYGGGGHLSANSNVYAGQPNGPYAAMQHYYQPPPPSGMASKSVTRPEASLLSKISPSVSTNAVTSRESISGISIPTVPGSSNPGQQFAASVAFEKQDLASAISVLGEDDLAPESTADGDDKSVKLGSSQCATVVAKDAVLPGKEEGSDLISVKDIYRSDSTTEVRQTNKKKKKKDPSSRGNAGDVPKLSKAVETKRQSDGETSEAQTSKLISKGVNQMETGLSCTAVTIGTMSEAVDVLPTAGPPQSCDGEVLTGNHLTMSDVSLNSKIAPELTKEVGVLDEEVPSNVSCFDVEASADSVANSVDKALTAELDLSSNDDIKKQSDKVCVQIDSKTSANIFDLSSKPSFAMQSVEIPIVPESKVSQTEATEEVIEGTSNVREAEICEVREAEATQDDVINPEVILEPESLSPSKVCKEIGGLQTQLELVESHSDVQVPLVSPNFFLHDAAVSVAADVKQGSKKKKFKDALAKADAAGSGDLYNAYKAVEQKTMDEIVHPRAGGDKSSGSHSVKQIATPDESAVPGEVDDWEDAVELPSPKGADIEDNDGPGIGEKQVLEAKSGETYTRDFLLTFKDQNLDLPVDFEVRADIVDLLLNPQAASARYVDHEMLSGRPDWQPSGGPRRSISSNVIDDERWARGSHGWPDGHTEVGPAGGFRPANVQGLIPRMPSSNRAGITVPPLVPVLLPGKVLAPGVGPGLVRTNTVDSDRWQKMSGGQKGLIPAPQAPFTPVHKAEKRYEVGSISDEEELKQRQIKGILNKLTPQNFEKLFEQVKDVNIQSALTLTGVISQIFDKALTEPTFCEMYATFCKRLATDMPEFIEDGDKVTFKRVLLNKCQQEFHRGEREQAEASLVEGEGNESMSAEQREEKRVKAKRRMLGNIRFIGELYKNHMLTERIMHECIRKLLGDYEHPEEEDVEALCKLMSTIGYVIDQPMTKDHIDAYLERISRLSNNQNLSARIRFMLKDLIDLRRNGWQERRRVEGPRRIEEVHRDAVQGRQTTIAQVGRLSRGPSIGTSSGRRLVLTDASARVPQSSMFSPTTPLGTASGARGVQTQGRAPLVQDVRMEDRLPMERSMPVPLSQRSADDGPLTLGPQGGLGRGLSLCNQPSGSVVAYGGETRRFGPASMAAYSSTGPVGAERPVTPPERPLLDRPTTASVNIGRSLRDLERTLCDEVPVPAENVHLEQQGLDGRPSTAPTYVPLTEEQLIKKSEAALLEYFSAHDPKEAALCVEDLRAPNFYPTMLYIWITLSFEKKKPDRELLAKLLISLQKSEPPVVEQEHIIQGFQAVLESLEDCVIDTPRAPEYIAHLLVKLVSAQVLSLDQAGDFLKKSEVLQSRFGLELLGKLLNGLCQERGESLLIEMVQSSRLHLEDFFATSKVRSKSLHEFLEEYSLQCLGSEPDKRSSTNNVQLVGSQLLDHFTRNEPVAETLRWLEKNAELQMQSESSFLQMLMTQVLTHLIPSGRCENYDRDDVVKEQLGHYRALLSKFATDEEKQCQYIIAMQQYIHDIGHPDGLMITLFSTLYQKRVISKSAFYKWQDDVNDPSIGRDGALKDVYRWLQCLDTAPENSQDDEF